jgi:hypothetical protein
MLASSFFIQKQVLTPGGRTCVFAMGLCIIHPSISGVGVSSNNRHALQCLELLAIEAKPQPDKIVQPTRFFAF